jgi:hypothetical protein
MLIAEGGALSAEDRERLSGRLRGAGKTILTEPQALHTEVTKLPGLDGTRMSKSYGNAIAIREEPAELLISNRCRHRAPNLTTLDRLVLGLCALFVSPRRIPKLGALVKPASSVRALWCRSNALDTRRPSSSKVRMPNVVRTTRIGCRASSSTMVSTMRTRCPANCG